jgi:hypothetical protein
MTVRLSLPFVLGALAGMQTLGGSWVGAVVLLISALLAVLAQALLTLGLAWLIRARGDLELHGLGVLAQCDGGGMLACALAIAAPLGAGLAALGLLLVGALVPELAALARSCALVVGFSGLVALLPAWPTSGGELVWILARDRYGSRSARRVTRLSGRITALSLAIAGFLTGLPFLLVVAAVMAWSQRRTSTAPGLPGPPGAPA